MGLLDKLKDTVSAVAEKAKETVDTAKAAYEQKKAEEAQHKAEMEALAAGKANEIVSSIKAYENDGSFFKNTTKEELLKFTKEFYDKILMPANSVSKSKIQMYPYIEDKQISKFTQTWAEYDPSETALVYLKAENKQEIVITTSHLYFSLALAEDTRFFVKGAISCDEVSKFSTVNNNTSFEFKCDEYTLASFTADKTTTEDFITLDTYFSAIMNHDFVITDEEVDKLIRQKIGEKIYAEVKKYMVYDDELLVYFAWGLDSLSAKDYIVCTNKQIIRMDREMFGATANIKQFYYEDIVSVSTEQNAKSNDLTGALIETALTAATKTCDLVITTAGAGLRINTLFKVEAERVVAVYHHYRKEIQTASSQPQVVVQQPTADPLEQLEKLSKMKEMGILSEEEFNEKKAALLSKI